MEIRIALALGISIAACDSAPPDGEARAENPFASAEDVDPKDSDWTGRVLERLDAGSYLYLHIERPGGAPEWVVTAEALANDAKQVRVHVVKRVATFESKRLGRSFSPLNFAIVRKNES